jgi:hypothetical protein
MLVAVTPGALLLLLLLPELDEPQPASAITADANAAPTTSRDLLVIRISPPGSGLHVDHGRSLPTL